MAVHGMLWEMGEGKITTGRVGYVCMTGLWRVPLKHECVSVFRF